MAATDEIHSDLARIGYALDMLPRWLDAVARGDMAPEKALAEITKDFREAPAAFERVKAALFDAWVAAELEA